MYSIGTPETDRDGVKWYPVQLWISPLLGFSINKIEKVVYLLHPTFSPSQVAVNNVKDNFTLRFKSYGDFHAMAVLVLKPIEGIRETIKLIRYLPIGISKIKKK